VCFVVPLVILQFFITDATTLKNSFHTGLPKGHNKLGGLLDCAISLKQDYIDKKICKDNFVRLRDSLVEQIKDFSFLHPLKPKLATLAKRLAKYKDSLFTFLYYDIPYHNNHAEQQIRPHVLLRKITFGNRSSKGILNHSVLTSIIQTAKLNKICSLNILREILLAGNTEKTLPLLIRSP